MLGVGGWRRESDEHCLGLMAMLKRMGEDAFGRLAGCCCYPLLLFMSSVVLPSSSCGLWWLPNIVQLNVMYRHYALGHTLSDAAAARLSVIVYHVINASTSTTQ